MVGLLTLVTNRVGSVTSTSFLVNFGDRRTVSGPMSRVSSGTLPGHSSTTRGLSAPAAGQAMHNQVVRETATLGLTVAPPGRGVASRRLGPRVAHAGQRPSRGVGRAPRW